MYESRKSYEHFSAFERSILTGSVLDIGAGPDPVVSHAVGFDQEQGDANRITEHVDQLFDCVYSSHCLEHMRDPQKALENWWQLVKPNGYLFFIVPDEDLYEQGVFPSRFNGDHKFTFTLAKKQSWSPVSVNVWNLVRSLPDSEILSLALNDIGYDHRLRRHGEVRSSSLSRFILRQFASLKKRGWDLLPRRWQFQLEKACLIDQTRESGLAQIEVILRKSSR